MPPAWARGGDSASPFHLPFGGVKIGHMENNEVKKAVDADAQKEKQERDKAIAKFWGFFALWACMAVVAPVAFIVWRYELFTPKTSYQFGGWGFVAVVIIAAFAISVFRYVDKGIPGWSMLKQVLKGLCRVTVPLLALYFALSSIASNIELFLQSLAVVTACETAAIPLNPLPKWAWDKNKEEYEGMLDLAFRKYDEHKEKREKQKENKR